MTSLKVPSKPGHFIIMKPSDLQAVRGVRDCYFTFWTSFTCICLNLYFFTIFSYFLTGRSFSRIKRLETFSYSITLEMRKIINNNIFNKMRGNIKLLNQFNETPELESQIVIGLVSPSDTRGTSKSYLLWKHSN